MKILHVIPSVASIRGGPSKAIFEMLTAIRSLGVDAMIATTNDNGSGLLDVPLNQEIIYQEVPIRFFSRFSPPLASIREFTFSPELTKWLWFNIENYDLVHVHAIFSYPSTIAMTIAELKEIPYILRPGGHLCQWALQQSKARKKFYLEAIGLRNINKSSGIHFTTDQEQIEANKLNILAPSFVLPHGIFCPSPVEMARSRLRQMLSIHEDEVVILFMSRLHPKKGLDYLIPALAQIREKTFTFVIAGSGTPTYESYIKELLSKHKMRNKTHLLGFVEGEIKNLLLYGSDLFVLTSYSENFGVAVLEALSAGLPTLITSGVALEELVLKYDLGYVADQNVESIKLTLCDFFKNTSLAKQKGTKGKQIVTAKYSWDNLAQKLIDIYDKAIENFKSRDRHKFAIK